MERKSEKNRKKVTTTSFSHVLQKSHLIYMGFETLYTERRYPSVGPQVWSLGRCNTFLEGRNSGEGGEGTLKVFLSKRGR